ncbi:hypothetical protein [Paenarthrobacter ureafaciens]|uniref:hypothetical protein n=1 Tax=Paenarthrobacter ureafaciens TaxID=37931 RepID=UPI0015BDB098|nr:hypothetical protein [Paenarthrobacter ureafaciens]
MDLLSSHAGLKQFRTHLVSARYARGDDELSPSRSSSVLKERVQRSGVAMGVVHEYNGRSVWKLAKSLSVLKPARGKAEYGNRWVAITVIFQSVGNEATLPATTRSSHQDDGRPVPGAAQGGRQPF